MTKEQKKKSQYQRAETMLKIINADEHAAQLLAKSEYGKVADFLNKSPAAMKERKSPYCAVGVARVLQHYPGSGVVPRTVKDAMSTNGTLPQDKLDRLVLRMTRGGDKPLEDVAKELNNQKIKYRGKDGSVVEWNASRVSTQKRAAERRAAERGDAPPDPSRPRRASTRRSARVVSQEQDPSFSASIKDKDGNKTSCDYAQAGEKVNITLTYSGSISSDVALGIKTLLEQIRLFPIKD